MEDEDAVRALVSAALSREGYRVLQAASAAEARELAAKAESVDLLLTHATMPGTSGMELARALVARAPAVRVMQKKPFTPSELRQRIREALDRPVP